MKLGWQTFDSSHNIFLQKQIWAMGLIATVGTKFKEDCQT